MITYLCDFCGYEGAKKKRFRVSEHSHDTGGEYGERRIVCALCHCSHSCGNTLPWWFKDICHIVNNAIDISRGELLVSKYTEYPNKKDGYKRK